MSPIAFVLILWWQTGGIDPRPVAMSTAVFADEQACNLAAYSIHQANPLIFGICTRQSTPGVLK